MNPVVESYHVVYFFSKSELTHFCILVEVFSGRREGEVKTISFIEELDGIVKRFALFYDISEVEDLFEECQFRISNYEEIWSINILVNDSKK